MRDVIGGETARVVERQRHHEADTLALDGLVKTFDLTVRLGVIGRSSDVGHAHDADELLEVLGDELWPVVADDAWVLVGNCSLARRMMVSTAPSAMFSR